jgi:hypothetical protein
MSSKATTTTTPPSWEWAKALPAFVREKGWRAKAYKGNKLQATYYHCSLFEVPPSFWAELLKAGEKEGGKEEEVEALAAGMAGCGLTRGEGGREEEGRVLEGEEEEEGLMAEGGKDGAGVKRMECRKCLCVFPVEERVAHYQSAWHLWNLRRGLAGK